MPIALEKPDSRMSVDPSSFNAASTSQVRLKRAYLGGLMEKQRRDPSHQEEEDSEDSDNLEAEIWCCKGKQVTVKPIAQNSNAREQPLAHGASSSVDKSNGYRSDMETLSPNIATHIPLYGSRLLHGQENLWKTTFRSYERFGRECSWIPLFEQQFISEKTKTFVKSYPWKTAETAFQRNRKADQWSDRNQWHKPCPRFEVDVDKLIAQSSLSIFHCRSPCLLRLCALFWKIRRQSSWILEEANSMVFGQQSFQRIESNWWTTYGIRVEDFRRIHYSGNYSVHERTSQAGSSSCQCLTTLSGLQEEMMNYA